VATAMCLRDSRSVRLINRDKEFRKFLVAARTVVLRKESPAMGDR